MQNGKKRGISILFKITGMFILPMILLEVVLMLYAMNALQKGMEDEALAGLNHLCQSVAAAYDAMDSGDYYMDGELLYKGEYCVTEGEDIIDSFTQNNDADITIFYGKIRRATSLADASTGKRIVGTAASSQVTDAILSGKKDCYYATDIEVNGENYYAC